MKKTILLFAIIAFFLFEIKAQTVTDIDGNVYTTVTIGKQVWMVENLKTTKYNDGSSIPLVTDDASWATGYAGYCWYNNDAATYKNAYGALYNWSTMNTSKLAPTGWHVPTDAEWTTLSDYLGGESIAGAKMKSTGTLEAGTGLWYYPNTGATNSSGFSAVPAGHRLYNGFYRIGNNGYWWSSSEDNTINAWSRNISYNGSSVYSEANEKYNGYSVRCVRDIGTGIDNINNRNEIKIYPNPAIDNINIDITNKNKTGTLTIYDLLGNIVLQHQIDKVQNVINVSSLKTGMYIIKISDSQIILQKKLIKK
jgi:uncharacterized protein (TIGR02145 family)